MLLKKGIDHDTSYRMVAKERNDHISPSIQLLPKPEPKGFHIVIARMIGRRLGRQRGAKEADILRDKELQVPRNSKRRAEKANSEMEEAIALGDVDKIAGLRAGQHIDDGVYGDALGRAQIRRAEIIEQGLVDPLAFIYGQGTVTDAEKYRKRGESNIAHAKTVKQLQ